MPDLPRVFGRAGTKKHGGYRKHGGRPSPERRAAWKFYNSKAWRTTSKRRLAIEPLCRMCKAEGKITPAKHVDHIDGNRYNNSERNYQSLCIACHTRKSLEDRAKGKG